MTNFLITGGAGFLGKHLTRDLLDKYPESRVRILDIANTTDHFPPYMLNGSVDLSLGRDICDDTKLDDDFTWADVVFHLAGIISFQRKDKEILERVHVNGTKRIMGACLKSGVEKVVHISSVASLGYNDDINNPIDETFQFHWEEAERWKKHYMITKHKGDLEVQRAIRQGLECVIAKPGLMWGPMGELNSLEVIKAINNRKLPFNMPGGTAVVDVRDISKGLIKMLEKGRTKEAYLLSGYNLSFKQINQTIAQVLGVEAPRYTLPRFLCDPIAHAIGLYEDITRKPVKVTADNVHSASRFRYFNSRKAEKELDWRQEYNFRQTIVDTIDWARQERYIEQNSLTSKKQCATTA